MRDLIVVGAGPAGCAAAVMAASLGQHVTIVEPGPVGGRLHDIGALENVPGGWATGPALAQALAADLARIQKADRCTLVQDRAVRVAGRYDRAEVTLANGGTVSAAAVVVATGVTALAPADSDWLTAPADLELPPLWRAQPDDLRGRTYVLGADRPLGTWLRSHPAHTQPLHVLYPAADAYKTGELADDERTVLNRVEHVTIRRALYGGGFDLEVLRADGTSTSYAVDTLLGNLGSRPAVIDGLARGPDGYCPPEDQHPRILTAGDLRSARFQRIVTAQGSGAQAALARYYEAGAA
jgi:thioredoxin reductase